MLAGGALGQATDADIQWQIKNLGNSSQILSDLAAAKLARYGLEAREALLHALGSDSSEVARRAGELLLRLPWTEPEDLPEAAAVLRDYAERSANDRTEVGYRLAALPIEKTLPVFLRLIAYEPNDAVAWQHTTRLKAAIPKCKEQLSAAKLPERPATLRLRSWVEPQQANQFMEKAVELSRRRVKIGANENAMQLLEWATLELTALYRSQKRFADVERCWRRQADENHDANAALELMISFLDRGQPQQVEAEWKRYSELLAGDSRAMYVVARAAAMKGDRDLERDLVATARSLRANEPDKHFLVGRYLMRRGWLEWAAGEFQDVLLRLPMSFETHYLLASIYEHRRDKEKELAALETALHLKEAQVQKGEGGEEAVENVKDLKCRLLLREAQRHRLARDVPAQEKALREAFALWPHHPDVVIALVELLRVRGERQEAAAIVEAARSHFRAAIERQPDAAQDYNNLAWLLANVEMHLDEARQLSLKSLELAPGTAAYLDTLAEVSLRSGQPLRAVEYQKQAVELEPESLDLGERLKKFEEAATKTK